MTSKRGKHNICSLFGCSQEHKHLFSVPLSEDVRSQWVNFIVSVNATRKIPKVVFVCEKHFTEDSFINLGQYKAGLADRLRLKPDAVPTLCGSATNLGEIVKDLPLLTSGQSSLTKTTSTETPERIQANPERNRRCAKTIIDIGSAFALWQKFREENGFKTDTELAFYLLSRTVCCANLSARRKKRKLSDVPSETEECESNSTQPRNGHHCTDEDEDMEVPEICYEVPPPYQTVEPAQTKIKSEDQLRSEDQIKSEDQLRSEDQIKSEDQLRSEDQIKSEDQPMSEDQIKSEDQPRSEDQIKSEDQLRSEDQIKSEDQPRSEDQIKSESQTQLEDQSVPLAFNNVDIIPESSTSAIKNEIKEEPVETEVQPENRLEVSMDSVTTSDKITPSFVQTVNPVAVEVKEEHTEEPLVPNKTHLTGLFRTCIHCGEPMQEYTAVSSGSLNQLQWKCSNGHLMCLFPNNNQTQTNTHLS